MPDRPSPPAGAASPATDPAPGQPHSALSSWPTRGPAAFPLALLGVCILAFGISIPGLGFYQDDWIAAWFAHAFGPGVFWEYFANERPFEALIYIPFTTLLGSSALVWHIFGLLVRWVCALTVWWLVRSVWPGRRTLAAYTALLFAVYPGFQEQALPLIYSLIFVMLALHLLSLGSTVWAVYRPAWRLPLTLLALLLGGLSNFVAEYFFAIELVRPVLIWLALGEPEAHFWRRLRRTLLFWSPYLALWLVYLYWRLFIFRFITYGPNLLNDLQAAPLAAAGQLWQTIVQDALDVSLFAWLQTLDFIKTVQPQVGVLLVNWSLVLAGGGLVSVYLLRANRDSSPAEAPPDRRFAWQAIGIGVFSLFTMGAPYWITGLPVELQISNDRFTLSFMLGASLLAVGLLELLVKTWVQKAVLVGVMAGLAIGLSFRTERLFRQENQDQDAFFRQLTWRAPGLRAGTLVLANDIPFRFNASNALNAPLNWIYSANPPYPALDTFLYFIPQRLGKEIPALEPGRPVEGSVRSMHFSGSTSQAIVVFFEPPRCLQVLDPTFHTEFPRLSEALRQAIPLSNLALITPEDPGPTRRMEAILGRQAPGWCYYFERADLARQMGAWEQAAALGEEARQAGLEPYSPAEWLPFISASAHLGDWQAALELSRNAAQKMPSLKPVLCQAWTQFQAEPGSTVPAQKIFSELGCAQP